jgi:oxalate decarboxylase/phosphoglucose isomerase-like protein (cupin superfamily)
MIRLPQKEPNKITFANEAIHYKIKPGTMIIIPGYTPHQYPVDMGLEPFRFIHWNIQVTPSSISQTTSLKEDDKKNK